MNTLINKLDLQGYIASFKAFLARSKPLYLQGDQQRHFEMIRAMEHISFNAPPSVENLDDALARLKKQGTLPLKTIFEYVKMVRYIKYLQKQRFDEKFLAWLEEIKIEDFFTQIDDFFLDDGAINVKVDERLEEISTFLQRMHKQIAHTLEDTLRSQKLQEYLVDKQIHLSNDQETLLLKAGFNHALKGVIISRSQGGFFYVVPDSVASIKAQQEHYIQAKEALLFEYAKNFSALLHKWVRYLEFINRRFDIIDHYQARIFFAQSKNYSFIAAQKDAPLILKDFAHPAINNPKPVSINASGNVIMITGVNAGGKTMLLKSLLSASYLAKYLLPMKINAHHSSIPHYKSIQAIIDDPQNVSNDISTFAGRMSEFSALLKDKEMLIGVDEVELGTDSDEAASLFKVLLEALIEKKAKIIVTTHHKRLAALMANRDDVTLIAALYDEVNRIPTYEFLQGSIGKSYAFETAKRYGIPANLVEHAIQEYGVDQAKLSELIERSSQLERELKLKDKQAQEKLEHIDKLQRIIEEERTKLHQEVYGTKSELSQAYKDAINQAKEAARAKDRPDIHRNMNKAHKKLPIKPIKAVKKEHHFSVGERVRYLSSFATILSIENKTVHIEFESGIKMRVAVVELDKTVQEKPKSPKVNISKPKAKSARLKLDLHGLRSDEAIDKLDDFLSDALLDGWDEVIVYHGIGTGKLAFAVGNFLKEHPSVKSFSDAPPQLGGYGAKVVVL